MKYLNSVLISNGNPPYALNMKKQQVSNLARKFQVVVDSVNCQNNVENAPCVADYRKSTF